MIPSMFINIVLNRNNVFIKLNTNGCIEKNKNENCFLRLKLNVQDKLILKQIFKL